MTSISQGIGSGATQNIAVSAALSEPWCEFLLVDVRLKQSQQVAKLITQYPAGINDKTMKSLNEEFNYYRGLFPLKVFISGPPGSGKTFMAKQLADQYGVPHITINDVVKMGMALENEYGQMLKEKIEQLIDDAQAEYDKSKKKKDPDFDRDTYKPRLPNDTLFELMDIQLNSAGCMNKGFILDGYPRSKEDAKNVFMKKVPLPMEEPADGEEAPEQQYKLEVNEKIAP